MPKASNLAVGIYTIVQRPMDAHKRTRRDAKLCKAWGWWADAFLYLRQSLTSEVLRTDRSLDGKGRNSALGNEVTCGI